MALTRRKERIWKRLKTEQSFEEFAQQRKYFGQVVCRRVKSYYHDIFANCKNNYKEVYKQANRLLFRKETQPVPPGEYAEVAQNFNSFFNEKVKKIMDHLNSLPVGEHGKMYLESDYMTNKCFQ